MRNVSLREQGCMKRNDFTAKDELCTFFWIPPQLTAVLLEFCCFQGAAMRRHQEGLCLWTLSLYYNRISLLSSNSLRVCDLNGRYVAHVTHGVNVRAGVPILISAYSEHKNLKYTSQDVTCPESIYYHVVVGELKSLMTKPSFTLAKSIHVSSIITYPRNEPLSPHGPNYSNLINSRP